MNNKNDEPVGINEVKLQETLARVASGEGSPEDENFIKELENLLGEPIIGGKLRKLGEKLKANKRAQAELQEETKNKLAKIESEKQHQLAELEKLEKECQSLS